MMSFKKVLILLSVSRLISSFLDVNSGSLFVAGIEPDSTPVVNDGNVIVDEDGEHFYDAVDELPVSTDEKKEEVITLPASTESGDSVSGKVQYKSRTVYIPKNTVSDAVAQASDENIYEEIGEPKETTVPVSYGEKKPASKGYRPPVPPRNRKFKELPLEVEDKLIGEALKMGTFISTVKPEESSSVVVNDEEIYYNMPDTGYENVGLKLVGTKDDVVGDKSRVPSASEIYGGMKSSAKQAAAYTKKRVQGAAHKTSKEAGKLADKVKYKSKDLKYNVQDKMSQAKDFIGNAAHETSKGTVTLGKKVKKMTGKQYEKAKTKAKKGADYASKKIVQAAQKTGRLGEKLKDTTKVTFKDMKTTTRVAMNDASKTLSEAAKDTKRKASEVGQKIKEKSDTMATGAKQAAAYTKTRLQGAAHKVSKEGAKLGVNIKTTGKNTKKSLTRFIRDKFGKLVPVSEVYEVSRL